MLFRYNYKTKTSDCQGLRKKLHKKYKKALKTKFLPYICNAEWSSGSSSGS